MGRHSSMAEQLKNLMSYRDRPDEEATVAANDNNPEDVAGLAHERKILVTPSVQEIMRQVDIGPVIRNDNGQVIRIGSLRFSDGTQTEKAHSNGPDGKVIQMDARMPVGAMLGTREETEAALGGKTISQRSAELSNSYFAASFGVEYPRYVPGGKKRKGRNYSRDEAADMLAAAIANTSVMPPVTHCPTALPCGTKNVSDAFNGMKKAHKGESGSIPWVDLATLQSNRSRWREVMNGLRPSTRKALDTAMSARSVAEVGQAVGQSAEYARRKGGMRALIEANDNLRQAMRDAA